MLTFSTLKKGPILRTAVLLIIYTAISIVSLYMGFELRYDFVVPDDAQRLRLQVISWIVPLKLSLLVLFGQLGGLLTYFRMPDLYRILGALLLTSGIVLALRFIAGGAGCPPRGVILTDFVLSLLMISGFRIALRLFRERFLDPGGNRALKTQRVAIVGAGESGAALAAECLAKHRLGMKPIVFLDDDKAKIGKHLYGIYITGNPESLPTIKDRYSVEKVIITLPSTSQRRIKEVYEIARSSGLETAILPSIQQLATGRIRAEQVRPVNFEDLLGRDPAPLDFGPIQKMLEDKTVLVAGAGGSIGSELCRQILAKSPKCLILLDHSEEHLFSIEQELLKQGYGGRIRSFIGNILDKQRLRYIFETLKPQLVFHAAAYKHVPLMEFHPVEAIKNNVFGTLQIALLSKAYDVERFILISTDKAINPTSVMGATKRIGEICIQALNQTDRNRTRFTAVRFGNVLGSSGSVIPIFKRQIAEDGLVTVTDAQVERYFMTISEAVGLLLQSASLGEGGEIFVLDMGEPIKIIDIARQLIRLSGFEPDVDIPIHYIGLRPGEKLYEELQHSKETLAETRHSQIFRFISKNPPPYQTIKQSLEELDACMYELEHAEVKKLLKALVPEYTPYYN